MSSDSDPLNEFRRDDIRLLSADGGKLGVIGCEAFEAHGLGEGLRPRSTGEMDVESPSFAEDDDGSPVAWPVRLWGGDGFLESLLGRASADGGGACCCMAESTVASSPKKYVICGPAWTPRPVGDSFAGLARPRRRKASSPGRGRMLCVHRRRQSEGIGSVLVSACHFYVDGVWSQAK